MRRSCPDAEGLAEALGLALSGAQQGLQLLLAKLSGSEAVADMLLAAEALRGLLDEKLAACQGSECTALHDARVLLEALRQALLACEA